MFSNIKGQSTKAHHHSTTGLNMLKNVWAKECLKQRLLRKAKNDVKHSVWIQSFFNFLSSEIKSDDILPEVKMNDVNNTEMGKANKSVKM